MEQTGLFDSPAAEPLAARVRPTDLDGFFGQEHLLGPGKILRRLIEEDRVPSMVLWGPPGVGKTTLARIIAGRTHSRFVDFSAVTSGIRVGTPAVTSRGFDEADCKEVGRLIWQTATEFESRGEEIRTRVAELTARHPIYE